MQSNRTIWQLVKEGALFGGAFALLGAAGAAGVAALLFGFALTPVVTGAAIMGAVIFGSCASTRVGLTWALPDGRPTVAGLAAGIAATFAISSSVPHPSLRQSSAATVAFTQTAAKAIGPAFPAASAPAPLPCFARQP